MDFSDIDVFSYRLGKAGLMTTVWKTLGTWVSLLMDLPLILTWYVLSGKLKAFGYPYSLLFV